MQWWRLRPDDGAWAGLSVASLLAWLHTVTSAKASVPAPARRPARSTVDDDAQVARGAAGER